LFNGEAATLITIFYWKLEDLETLGGRLYCQFLLDNKGWRTWCLWILREEQYLRRRGQIFEKKWEALIDFKELLRFESFLPLAGEKYKLDKNC
jgi:hypothetical protein